MLAALLLAAGGAHADTLAEVQRLVRSGQLASALEASAGADRRDAPTRFLRGVILMDLNRDDEAAQAFGTLLEDFPELADPYNNLALLHARAGRYDAARVALENALRNDPQHVLARENLGDVYLLLALQAWSAVPGAPSPALQRKLQAARSLVQELPRR